MPFDDVLEEMTRVDTEEVQESSDEVSDKTEKLLTQLSIVSYNAVT